MKVDLDKECYYDGGANTETVVKVFDDEVKALVWKEEFDATDYDWRAYEEMEVE
jgi:hypothetical protein